MTKLTDLPGYSKLTSEEKKRLKEVYKTRLAENYNILGEDSISKKELNRAKEETNNG